MVKYIGKYMVNEEFANEFFSFLESEWDGMGGGGVVERKVVYCNRMCIKVCQIQRRDVTREISHFAF